MKVEITAPSFTTKVYTPDSLVFVNEETYGEASSITNEEDNYVLFVNPARIACLAVHYD